MKEGRGREVEGEWRSRKWSDEGEDWDMKMGVGMCRMCVEERKSRWRQRRGGDGEEW